MLQALHDIYLRYKWEKEGDWDTIMDYFYDDDIFDIAVDVVEKHYPNIGVYKSALLTDYLILKLKNQSDEFKKQLLT